MAAGTTSLIEHWLEQLRNGEDAARNEILRYSERRLRLHTHRMFRRSPILVSLAETDDVLTLLQMRLNNALEKLPDVYSARSFFKLAAKHLGYALVDLYRKYTRNDVPKIAQPEGPNPDGPTPTEVKPDMSDSNDPATLLMWGEIHEKIQKLPEDEKEVFELLWYQGLPQRDAARILDISVNALEWLWLKARRRLAGWLQDRNGFE